MLSSLLNRNASKRVGASLCTAAIASTDRGGTGETCRSALCGAGASALPISRSLCKSKIDGKHEAGDSQHRESAGLIHGPKKRLRATREKLQRQR